MTDPTEETPSERLLRRTSGMVMEALTEEGADTMNGISDADFDRISEFPRMFMDAMKHDLLVVTRNRLFGHDVYVFGIMNPHVKLEEGYIANVPVFVLATEEVAAALTEPDD